MFGRKMDEISKDETVASCRSHTVVLEPSRPKGVAESRLGSWNELDPCKVQDAAPPYRSSGNVELEAALGNGKSPIRSGPRLFPLQVLQVTLRFGVIGREAQGFAVMAFGGGQVAREAVGQAQAVVQQLRQPAV